MDELSDLLEEIDIEDYIGQYVDLEPDGDELFGVCPFHNDSDPSFSVTPSRNVWFCFGCHKGGNVFTFAKQYHNLSGHETVEHLKSYAGLTDEDLVSRHLNAVKVIKRFSRRRSKKESSYKVLPSDIMMKYQDGGSHLDIWRAEGISDEVMERYQVKYDPFSNRIVFPIRLPNGKIINVCGRTLNPNYKTELDRNGKHIRKYTYFYDLGILDTLFGLYEHMDSILKANEIILFEGAKSVMLAETWGITNTAAVLTSKINKHQLKLLIGLGVRIVFALDAGIVIRDIPEVKKLRRFARVDAVINRDGLLKDKEAPVDQGYEVWADLYERRCHLK